jgi:hypothetical protein
LATKELVVASRQRTVSYFRFQQGISLLKTKRTVVPDPPYVLFSRLKKKLKGRHFDAIEVMEPESQAVLNSLTEHNFQGAFKMADSLRKGTTSRVRVASRLKVRL